MRIARAHAFGDPDVLQIDTVEAPQPDAGEIRIAVKALGVNPVDWKLLTGKAAIPIQLPHVPGGDVAGIIDAVGAGVTKFKVGDRVFALIGLSGAFAEQVVVAADAVAALPVKTSFEEGAALPLVALTVLQGLAIDGRDIRGLNILIHNGAGGVGMAAIQIAKAMGARVTATASVVNAPFVMRLGADSVVDFRVTPVADHGGGFDIMMDLVGDSPALELWALIKNRGSVIRIAGGADAPAFAADKGIRAHKVRVKPDGGQLARLAKMLEKGQLRAEVARTFPFESVADALKESMAGHVRGKIVLTVG